MVATESSRKLIVIFASALFDDVRRSAKALSKALSRHVCVLYVDPSSSSLGRDGALVLGPGLRRVARNLYHLPSISIPGHTRPGFRVIARSAVVAAVRSAIDELETGPPLAVLLQTPQVYVLGRFGEAVSVLWATDAFASGASLMGMDRDTLVAGEKRAAAMADLVVAVSDRLAETWRIRGMSTVVIPHGVDVLPLPAAPVPDDLSLPRPIAVVAGTLSERLDFSILEKVADSGMSLVLIGPASFRIDRAEFDRLCARHNVEWLGVKDHSDLATYYQHIDVGLVPYTLSNFNLDSAPLKPLEYLAGGLPVVSTSLPGVIAISSPDIEFADDPVVFAMATQVAARLADDMDLVTRRRSHLDEWSWDARARELLSVLDRRSSSDRF